MGLRITRGPQRAYIKLNLHKAFDTLNTGYIVHILGQMGFLEYWIGLIKGYISSPSFLVILNRAPNGFFNSSRGMRQGDPISPYLFCLVTEGHSGARVVVLRSKEWETYHIANTSPISNLQFAENILVFAKASVKSLCGLEAIFNRFRRDSNMQINIWKSYMYLSKEGMFPVKYWVVSQFKSQENLKLWLSY